MIERVVSASPVHGLHTPRGEGALSESAS